MRVPSSNLTGSSKDPLLKTPTEIVAENMGAVTDVSNNIDNVNKVAENEVDIKEVSGISPEVSKVAAIEQHVRALSDDLANIDLVASELGPIINVSNNMAALLLLHSRMQNLLNIEASLPNIEAVAANESNINAVVEHIPEITTCVAHMADIVYVAANKDTFEALYTNLDAMLTLESNLDAVNTLNDNMDIIIEASTYVEQIEENLRKVEAAEANVIALEAEAETHAANALTSANNSASSAADSAASAAQSEASKVASEIARVGSETAESNSAASAASSQQSASQSATSASNASGSATLAEDFMEDARDYRDASAVSAANAATSEGNASVSEANALSSEGKAKTSETNAKTSETNSAASEGAAASSEANAAASQSAAAASASSAASDATAATNKANEASASASNSEASAIRAEAAAVSAQSALTPRGDWNATVGAFPTPTLAPERADFYQISGAGTMTDSNPAQPDVSVEVGDQLYWHMDRDIWYKIDNTDQVTSVDGKKGAVIIDKYTRTEADAITDPIKARAEDTYTKSEEDAKEVSIYAAINTKSDKGHTHVEADITDLDKYTQAETDNLLSSKEDTSSVNSKLNQKADKTAVAAITSSTGAVEIPAGSSDQRPTGAKKYIRFNTETGNYEGFDGVEWGAIGGSGIPEYRTESTEDVFTLERNEGVRVDVEAIDGPVSANVPAASEGFKEGEFFSVGYVGKATHPITLYSADFPFTGFPLGETMELEGDYAVYTFSLTEGELVIVNSFNENGTPNAIKSSVKGTFPEGTTTFNLTYDVGFVDVFIEGMKMPHLTYNAGDGQTVTIPALLKESYVEILAWNHVEVQEATSSMIGHDSTGSDINVNTVKEALDIVTKKSELLDKVLTEYANPNLLINGQFDAWQRGTSGTATSNDVYVAADRWLLTKNSTSQTRITADETQPETYRLSLNSLGNTYAGVSQRIEECRRLSGKEITISFNIRDLVNTAEAYIRVGFVDSLGNRRTAANPDIPTPTVSGRKFITVTVPNDYQNDDSLEVAIYANKIDTAGSSMQITRVKVEEGNVATPFVPDSPQVNLAKCQRYYERGEFYLESYSVGNGSVSGTVQYSTSKRIAPPLSGVVITDTGSAFTTGVWQALFITDSGFRAQTIKNATQGQFQARMAYTADAEL